VGFHAALPPSPPPSPLFYKTDDFFDYLTDNVDDDGNVASLQTWFQTLSVGFFALAALQLGRCGVSHKLVQYVKLDASELRAALLLEATESRVRRDDNQTEVGHRAALGGFLAV
jgi:hypothetical protein